MKQVFFSFASENSCFRQITGYSTYLQEKVYHCKIIYI